MFLLHTHTVDIEKTMNKNGYFYFWFRQKFLVKMLTIFLVCLVYKGLNNSDFNREIIMSQLLFLQEISPDTFFLAGLEGVSSLL